MEKSKQKHWQAYRSNNPGQSPYIETDYKAGFEDGYKAKNSDLRARMAMVAMNAFIQRGEGSFRDMAYKAVVCADALIRELDKQ